MPVLTTCTWSAQWGNPYTSPPHGEPRQRLSVTVSGSTRDIPPAILAAAPPGSGWCVAVRVHSGRPRRRMSQAGRAKVRRRNLERRVTRQAPLFAAQIIAAELAARPDYFAGAEYPYTTGDHR
jgi:hypothetical protein